MGQLIYLTWASLDGFIGDGDFSWAEPDEEAKTVLTDDVAQAATALYGRRTYETMAVWETMPELAEQSPENKAFADVWQAADKIVFSSTLQEVPTRRTRVERHFDARVVDEARSRGDLTIGGPTLAAEAFRHDLVDVVEVFWAPALLGTGIPVFSGGVRRNLTLRSERRFANGVVRAVYDVIRGS